MQITFDQPTRREQKRILREHYPDYDPVHHDAFVDRWNREQDKAALAAYHQRRAVTDHPPTPVNEPVILEVACADHDCGMVSPYKFWRDGSYEKIFDACWHTKVMPTKAVIQSAIDHPNAV